MPEPEIKGAWFTRAAAVCWGRWPASIDAIQKTQQRYAGKATLLLTVEIANVSMVPSNLPLPQDSELVLYIAPVPVDGVCTKRSMELRDLVYQEMCSWLDG